MSYALSADPVAPDAPAEIIHKVFLSANLLFQISHTGKPCDNVEKSIDMGKVGTIILGGFGMLLILSTPFFVLVGALQAIVGNISLWPYALGVSVLIGIPSFFYLINKESKKNENQPPSQIHSVESFVAMKPVPLIGLMLLMMILASMWEMGAIAVFSGKLDRSWIEFVCLNSICVLICCVLGPRLSRKRRLKQKACDNQINRSEQAQGSH